jgi:hypothetical protein
VRIRFENIRYLFLKDLLLDTHTHTKFQVLLGCTKLSIEGIYFETVLTYYIIIL